MVCSHFKRELIVPSFDCLGIDISRPYTIVVPSFDFKNGEETKRHLYLIIKIYPSGTLTPSLLDVNIGENRLNLLKSCLNSCYHFRQY